MGARRRLRSRGPVTMDIVTRHNTHGMLTYEDLRWELEEGARRAEAKARRDVQRDAQEVGGGE